MKYVALLRGINVGGHKIIPMAKLKSVFESDGFKNVSTFIQSGNVLFESASTASALRTKIEKLLLASFGFEVTTMIRSAQEMKSVVARNPFVSKHREGKTKFYVAFLERKPSTSEQNALLATQVKGLVFRFGTCEVYILLDATFSGNNSPFANTKLEKSLQQSATTRNWATTNTLNELLQ